MEKKNLRLKKLGNQLKKLSKNLGFNSYALKQEKNFPQQLVANYGVNYITLMNQKS